MNWGLKDDTVLEYVTIRKYKIQICIYGGERERERGRKNRRRRREI